MKKLYFTFLLSMLAMVSAQAALTSGYYTIKNPGYGRYMYEDFTSKTICTSTSYADTDYEKIWKLTVSGSSVTLQNVYTGHYAQTQSSTSSQFTTGSSAVSFTLTSNSDGTYMFNSGSYMHCAATQSYYVVNWWDSSSTYSMWEVEAVSLTDAQVASIQEEYAAVENLNNSASSYNTILSQCFTDLSCTELASNLKNYTDATLKSVLKTKGLPDGLQDIAVRVKNGTWEGASTSAIAQQFRVHDYQAYTRAWYWRDQLRATQFTDMNNPTGIYLDSKETAYIFVGGDIPDGCQLRVACTTGNEQVSFAAGVELSKGLNAIQGSANNQHLWIMYTYTGDTQVDMSTLAKLKIHIEGGKVYGYTDVTGLNEANANTEYKKVLDNANTIADNNSVDKTDLRFVVKGNRGVFYFPLDTYNQIWKTSTYYGSYTTNYNIWKSIHWFDNVLAWEWGIMGFTKRVYEGQTDEHEHVTGGRDVYPTYCNNLALTVQNAAGTNPYSTTGYTSMPGVGGVESSYNAERADFDNWCVGHESGHNNQGAINLPSSTESSNNLFSNVVTYLHGYRMSRGEPVSTTNADYQKGVQFALRDIGSTHRMYWQLYLYYHEAQRKTDFYPTLFESLRNDGMDLNSGQCFLKFYQKACDAAGEDLTEYFRGWGFFVPFDNQEFGDYTTRTLTLTQAEIDAAIATVKAKGYSENTAIMFVEDRIEESYRWDAWASGTTDVRPVQSHAVGTCGEMGSVNDYAPGATAQAANYTSYTLTGNTLTLNGDGGAGVLVYDADGNLVAFGNSRTLTISDDALASGTLTVKVVDADNTQSEVQNVTEVGTDAEKLEALNAAIEAAQKIVNDVDETESKVGYYYSYAVEDLSTLLAQAQAAVSAGNASLYSSLTNQLNQAVGTVSANENAKIAIDPSNKYALRNYVYTSRYATNSSDKMATNENTTLTDAEKWQFVSTGEQDQYYLMSVSSGKYLSSLGTSTQAAVSAESTSDALIVTVEPEGTTGVLKLKTNASGYSYLHCAASQSYYVVGWTEGATASWWHIEAAEVSEEALANAELKQMINKSQQLLNEVTTSVALGNSTVGDKLTLQVTDSSADFYLSTNHQETSEGEIQNLIDDDTSTFFHSSWSVTTTDKHWLQVDLGAGNEMDLFQFSLKSRNKNPNNFPCEITVMGSNDGENFMTITQLTNSLATSGLVEYQSDVIGLMGTSYRYLRFVVDKTGSGNGNNTAAAYYFFALSEFTLSNASAEVVVTKKDDYSDLTDEPIASLWQQLQHAISVAESGTAKEKEDEVTALKDLYEPLWFQVYGPREGRTYRILSARSGWNLSKAMTSEATINGGTTVASPGWEDVEASNQEQWWQFIPTSAVGVYQIQNVKTKTYITTASSMSESGANILLTHLGSLQFSLTIEGQTNPLHCRNQADSYVSSSLTEWTAQLNNASAWMFEEVETASGDVNLDGNVDVSDVTMLVNIILGTYTGEHGVADINGDGSVNISDVTALVDIILGR